VLESEPIRHAEDSQRKNCQAKRDQCQSARYADFDHRCCALENGNQCSPDGRKFAFCSKVAMVLENLSVHGSVANRPDQGSRETRTFAVDANVALPDLGQLTIPA